MRPVDRGPWPVGDDGQRVSFADYRHARAPLIKRLGEYCSYCERGGDLHVEHVVPQSKCPRLETEWSNFLLGCVNCNSRKSNDNDSRDEYLWPDRDDTFNAFMYRSGGRVTVNGDLDDAERAKACALYGLVGLGEDGSPTDRRRHKRREAWNLAERVRGRIRDENSRALAIDVALGSGFFSVWMAVFHDDEDMRRRLVEAFPGTRR